VEKEYNESHVMWIGPHWKTLLIEEQWISRNTQQSESYIEDTGKQTFYRNLE